MVLIKRVKNLISKKNTAHSREKKEYIYSTVHIDISYPNSIV